MIPRATYRLQFRKEFTFDDACGIVPYLARLGISHIYASPILASRKGSPHGYDVIDHTRIDPELGGEEAFRRLAACLKEHGMGMILDIVPNHMAASDQNPWWRNVLEHGRDSAYAHAFDIDWEPADPTLKNRVLLPVLGASLCATTARGEISVRFDKALGKPVVAYAEHGFPLRPEDCRELADEPLQDREALLALLHRQHYRLAWWRTAGDLINWRRFFDINDLVALRMEDESVFESVHVKIFSLYAEGLIDGVRVDHMDGLADPAGYCRQLRTRLDSLRPTETGGAYMVVEKILAPGEELPSRWPIQGTTGYDFMNDVTALLHDAEGAEPLARLWAEISGRRADFDGEARDARLGILKAKFQGALAACVRSFYQLITSAAQDATEAALERALERLLAELRIYRTYATGAAEGSANDRFFEAAVERAVRRRMPANDSTAMADIVEVMEGRTSGTAEERRAAVRRFNQLAASLAAKAGEDTAFYRYGRLLSRNEVGSDPREFFISPGEFHDRARRRLGRAPLLATATHDHKRGEDARMRLAVLSEISAEWAATVASWFELNGRLRDKLLDPGDEYQLYQTLVGSWPLDLDWQDAAALGPFTERIRTWRLKSLHEAKLHTSWSDPDATYDDASTRLVRELLDPHASAEFLRRLSEFVHRIAPAAAQNGLAQCVLRCTAPGVPDLYQGSEFWDFSLVDPDNRRPVDFGARNACLESARDRADWLTGWRDGAIKQGVIAQLLQLRARFADCFQQGEYRPLEAEGAHAGNTAGFARTHHGMAVLVVVPRLCACACIETGAPAPAQEFWKDTAVCVPPETRGREWRSIFGPEIWDADEGRLSARTLFGNFPVAVLAAG
ncbi:MAG TPA: malto-oligosyltrehalose synthase [Rhizomicrobium sp.]|nr:malto-oligosyltrehalose synthase [Rhizomicrobium sp.]